jgi:spoIIIJ-associated protein
VEWVETTGRTVAEALDRALDQLGVDEQEAEVQVLDEPQKGLFGRLRVEARVRARVRPVRPRPKAERRDRRRRGGGSDRERRGRGRERGGTKAPAVASGGGGSRRTSSGSEVAGNGSGGGRAAGSSSTGGNGTDTDQGREQASGDGANRKRRRRRRGGQAKKQGAVVENVNQDTSTEPRPEADAAPVAEDAEMDVEAQREAVESFLVGLLAAFGRPEAKVTVVVDEESTIDAKVDGDGLGLLVGPKGHTLQSVHELVRSMVQRRFVGESHARIRVDVAGYRQRRREALERFTRTVAEEVVSTGRAKVLDPMNASDRKVVHDVINELDGVSTISEGIDPDRRVIIQPR